MLTYVHITSQYFFLVFLHILHLGGGAVVPLNLHGPSVMSIAVVVVDPRATDRKGFRTWCSRRGTSALLLLMQSVQVLETIFDQNYSNWCSIVFCSKIDVVFFHCCYITSQNTIHIAEMLFTQSSLHLQQRILIFKHCIGSLCEQLPVVVL